MMNKRYVSLLSERNTPNIKIHVFDGMLRHEVVNRLQGSDNVGIELGVAEGVYSKRMVESGKFKRFFGVDAYGDIHDTSEYKRALKHIGLSDQRYSLLRTTFENAADLFEDEYFDFIYIDGFAHTGEEGGKSLVEWYRKLKTGGILAGDDYHDDWPLVKWAVNDLACQVGVDLNITGGRENTPWSLYPTWFFEKPNNSSFPIVNELLYKVAMSEKTRIHKQRVGWRTKYRMISGKCLCLAISLLKLLGLKEIVANMVRRFR